MNYIHQINSFWNRDGIHEELSAVSVAVYFALLHLNNISGWKSKIRVHPREVMDLVKIGSTKTFYDHLKKLNRLGLIQYNPGKNQYRHTYLVLPKLYEGKDLPLQKIHGQSNTKETPLKSQLPERSLQRTDNQEGYKNSKLLNHETSKLKKTKDFSLNDLEENLFSIYKEFIKERIGCPTIASTADRRALKNITKYMYEANSNNPASVWEKIFSNWKKLDPFYQSKISLEQIEKNLLSIIDQIGNYHETHKSTHSKNDSKERSHAKRKNFRF